MLDNKCVTSGDQKDGLFLPECWLLKENSVFTQEDASVEGALRLDY